METLKFDKIRKNLNDLDLYLDLGPVAQGHSCPVILFFKFDIDLLLVLICATMLDPSAILRFFVPKYACF
jgi:hypothetical protein